MLGDIVPLGVLDCDVLPEAVSVCDRDGDCDADEDRVGVIVTVFVSDCDALPDIVGLCDGEGACDAD